MSIYVHRSQSNKTVLIVLHDSQFSIDPIRRRSTRKEKQSLPRPTINKIPPFESGKRYPQNVSINSNFTVDESFEARNIGFALSSETGCFSSRLRDERWNAMHLSWRRCFPETWGKHLSCPTPTGRARSLARLLKLEKRRDREGKGKWTEKVREGGGWGFERKDGIHIFPPTKRTTAFWESFGVAALFIIVGRHKRRECGKRRKTRVSRTDEFPRFLAAFRAALPFVPRWGRSWPSFCLPNLRERSILEGRTSVSHERKKEKKEENLFDDLFELSSFTILFSSRCVLKP